MSIKLSLLLKNPKGFVCRTANNRVAAAVPATMSPLAKLLVNAGIAFKIVSNMQTMVWDSSHLKTQLTFCPKNCLLHDSGEGSQD